MSIVIPILADSHCIVIASYSVLRMIEYDLATFYLSTLVHARDRASGTGNQNRTKHE